MKRVSNCILYCFSFGVLAALLAGALALVGFIIALCIGGDIATDICVFIHKTYFPWVIRFTTIFVGLGLLGMYLTSTKALTISTNDESNRT